MSTQTVAFDYIVVGSGAGGGPLAANLARAGFKVLLLEAGGDPLDMPDAGGKKTRSNYLVPALHGRSTEDVNLRWDYFVQHYGKDKARQSRAYDSKYDERNGGIWYPRAGTLGGCTAHNAMITVYPHDRDWDDLARELGDDSWSAANMRPYFEKLERCRYRPPGTPGHGSEGWLSTELPDPRLAFGDVQLLKAILGAAIEVLESKGQDPTSILAPILSELEPMLSPAEKMLIATLRNSLAGLKSLESSGASGVLGLLEGPIKALKAQIHTVALELIGQLLANDAALKVLQKKLDPNAAGAVDRGGEGLYMIPLATDGGRRNGTREVIERARSESGGNLTVRTGVLVTRVLFDDDEAAGTLGRTAVGVEFIPRPHMYRADPTAASFPTPAVREQQFVRREVILSAGTFNTPQLLMLSGIGPRADVERFRRDDDPARPAIPCRADLPGVGRNLQDRYEVGVISEMTSDFSVLQGCQFEAPLDPASTTDPCYKEWEQGRGVYTTNGAVISVILRSSAARAQGGDPDLFLFGLAGYFKGYFQSYSFEIEGAKNHFTWAILKAHTRNRDGSVKLRSADPRDTPTIDFAYFDEGSPGWEADLQAVAEGVDFVRQMTRNSDVFVKSELLPGGDIDDPDEVRRFVMKEAWGHHACGTCKMGPDGDPTAVLDEDFKVRGIDNLRVVDASVFPRIPGFFIVTPIYMISEKASQVILAEAGAPAPSGAS